MDLLSPNSHALEPAPAILAEKRDLLARLLARLAHEIGNPLSSLDIHVQLLNEDLAQAPLQTRQRIDIIRGELGRLESIVRRFLRLASPSTLELEEVELPQIIGQVCKLLGPEAESRQIELVTTFEDGLTPIRADGVQLTQVLLNLLINALQAASRGGRIEIRAGLPPADNQIQVEVHDSGPGISPDRLAAVFEPYFTTKEEGSGLGLWIAQQIATAHGGTLDVSNAPEGGAVFRLRIPIAQNFRSHG